MYNTTIWAIQEKTDQTSFHRIETSFKREQDALLRVHQTSIGTHTMPTITSIEDLEALYGPVNPKAVTKVTPVITTLYKQWIEASKFLILSTVGPEGTDASPRGDDGPVATILDNKTLAMPDWRGNNRLDSLRNIVRDPRVSLMFMVHSSENVVRVNGTATITSDDAARKRFEQQGKLPATVIVVSVEELYFQCAKAIMRSKLWKAPENPVDVPTAGQFIKEMDTEFDAKDYDESYADRAKGILW